MTRLLLAHDLHSHHDPRGDGPGFLEVFFFFVSMVIASISVLVMVILACGQDADEGSGNSSVSYYGSHGRYVSSAGGGDGSGTGAGGGCGGCGGGCA